MNSNEKRWILLLIAVVTLAIVLIVVLIKGNNNEDVGQAKEEEQVNEEKYTTELADGTKLNTSEEFNTTKTYGNLSISNIQFTEKNGMSVLLADATNKGSTKHELEVVKITILGENGEEITQINPIIEEIEPGETVQINASITADVSNAKDFRIEGNSN